jgi:hypothetical protein
MKQNSGPYSLVTFPFFNIQRLLKTSKGMGI